MRIKQKAEVRGRVSLHETNRSCSYFITLMWCPPNHYDLCLRNHDASERENTSLFVGRNVVDLRRCEGDDDVESLDFRRRDFCQTSNGMGGDDASHGGVPKVWGGAVRSIVCVPPPLDTNSSVARMGSWTASSSFLDTTVVSLANRCCGGDPGDDSVSEISITSRSFGPSIASFVDDDFSSVVPSGAALDLQKAHLHAVSPFLRSPRLVASIRLTSSESDTLGSWQRW